MALPGECVNDVQTKCWECRTHLTIGVYRSAAGFYIGFFCPNCGPYSRESGYYQTEEEAKTVLEKGFFWR